MFTYTLNTRGELYPYLNFEWLLTNGRGAFASSSVVGCNRRRYHGLLCAATNPPVGRLIALSRVGEIVHLDGKADFHELSINQFNQSFHPRGDRFLRAFRLGECAQWEYEFEGIKLTRTLVLYRERNAIALRYHVECGPERTLRLRLLPFVAMRDFHSLCHKDRANLQTHADARHASVSGGGHTLHLTADFGEFEPRQEWWFSHTYALETERGQDDQEDLFVPAHLVVNLSGRGGFTLFAGLDGDANGLPDVDDELAARVIPGDKPGLSPAMQRLVRAANDFVVRRKTPAGDEAATIIAGYPWFADWGRDTMISLPGLLLCTGRHAEAAETLRLFARYVSEGMIPNHFDDYTSQPSYNTVDASLWFIHACFEYLRHTKDQALFDSQLRPACEAIAKGYRLGTRFGIHMDAEGLIVSGDPSTQLTWMDAKCDGVAFTPRHGKAVEINALWYNALMLLGHTEQADRTREAFQRKFWINPFRGLFDVVHDDRVDTAVRPNQIFAVSLPHSPLSLEQQSAVVETVRRDLLTPYGLRTLARDDANYHGRYTGNRMSRDRAYHNGTVWAWLIGPFLESYLKVHGHSADAQRQARVWLQPLLDHMNQSCIGQISECFEGDEPHRPVGCPAQAWSVAEVLRIAQMAGL
ncbi:MAG: amylo-alpha-1,6-glucosidase [Tepidisphaeraceae bacterium]|jgi:predicted glycogen debranching enzyme